MTSITNNPVKHEATHYTTQSRVKSFKECPRKYKYSYVDKLVSTVNPHPPALLKGTWLHDWLEAYYRGWDTSEVNSKYENLVLNTPPVMERYPNIIRDMQVMQRAYLKHWEFDDAVITDTEFHVNGVFPSGLHFRGRADALMVLPDGTRWIVDHKTYKFPPKQLDRELDIQSALYVHFANQSGLNVDGFAWNYIIWTPPSGVNFNVNGSLASRQPVTEYTTVLQSLTDTGRLDTHGDLLEQHRQVLYYPGNPLRSKLFYREFLRRTDESLERIVMETDHVGKLMGSETVFPPNPSAACSWCDFSPLCTAETRGEDCSNVLQDYTTRTYS